MMKFFTLAVLAIFVSSGLCQEWNSVNDPRLFISLKISYNFSDLPTVATLDTIPWSDTYWPSYQSGIAHRYNSQTPNDFNYSLYTKAELLKSSEGLRKSLSPAEKFDIYNARYDYPTVHAEWMRTSPDDAKWEGICHGWAVASLTFEQPNPISMVNRDGIVVHFGSSDIKALLSFFAGQYDKKTSTWFVGARCYEDLDRYPEMAESPQCKDMNAGSFHIIMMNALTQRKGFVIDRDRGYQVWNQPVYSLESSINSYGAKHKNSPDTATKSVYLESKLRYAVERIPSYEPQHFMLERAEYAYRLDLDDQDNIVGGDWISFERVDFAWMRKINPFFGYFSSLKDIYIKSTSAMPYTSKSEEHNSRLDFLTSSSGYHNKIIGSSGIFSSGKYRKNAHYSWVLGPAKDSLLSNEAHIEITFNRVDIAKHEDFISVYEGAEGNYGALVAIIHGKKQEPLTIKVKSKEATVTLTTSENRDEFFGFEATYRIIDPLSSIS